MAAMTVEEGLCSGSAASVVMDVLRQHGSRLNGVGMEMRKAEEAATRRYEAANWLRSTVGAACLKDLPEEPTEEEFRRGLRGGFILCNALNKVQPGAVPKVVECPVDSNVLPEDGTALSAYQYFENIRNFFVAVQELGLPMFEASDLEEGGKMARVVNCVLALKSYSEWKQAGGIGCWKYGGIQKSISTGKFASRRNPEFLFNISLKNASNEHNSNGTIPLETNETVVPRGLNSLVRTALSGKKPDELPMLFESILIKVMEEFDRPRTSQSELIKTNTKSVDSNKSSSSRRKALAELAISSVETKVQSGDENVVHAVDNRNIKSSIEESKGKFMKQILIVEKQQKLIEELKHDLVSTRAGMQYIQTKYSEEFCNLGVHLKRLSQVASGYHEVLAENRKLYNQVQDLKGSIRVYCRVRPFLPGQSTHMSTVGHLDDGSISIITPSKYGKEGRKSFNFNKVFGPSATQDEVFLDTQPLIRSVLDGYNVCIFAYGQTGSGKTYTMTGPKDLALEGRGVNYRALNDLFQLSEQRRDAFHYEISVQMTEIYNEQVRDLLSTDGLCKKLDIRNSSQTGINVPDAALIHVTCTSDVVELMNIGLQNRVVGATALNDRSSRSHSCLTVHVQGRELASGTILRGSMHLVDLAGSERVNKSEVTGERLKEAQHINKSLSALGDVIAALAQKNSHVPYRNSKLTQLLQDSLGGQAKTLMFVHISPEADAIGETLSTLKFAERVSTVELGAARINKESTDVRQLKEQIAQLKEALMSRGTDLNQHMLRTPVSEMRKMNTDIPSPLLSSQQINQSLVEAEENNENDVSISGKKAGLNTEELLMADDTLSWPDSISKGDEREMMYQNWVDKIMVSKQEFRDDDWQLESAQLPESFFQRFNPETRIFRDNVMDNIRRKDNQEFNEMKIRSLSTPTDESDDVGTSDSSEADLLSQCSITKLLSQCSTTKSAVAISRSVSRLKKPQARPPISPDTRTPARAHVPSPSTRKVVTQTSFHTPNRTMRQADRMRQSSVSKIGSKK